MVVNYCNNPVAMVTFPPKSSSLQNAHIHSLFIVSNSPEEVFEVSSNQLLFFDS